MKYKIVFLDIDGTILGANYEYTDLTKKAIIEAKENGLEVFIATGRPLHEIRQLGEELNIQSFIAYNGALAEYKGEIVVHDPIDRQITDQIMELTNRYGQEIVTYTNDKSYVTSLNDASIQSFIDHFNINRTEKLDYDRLNELLSMTVLKIDEDILPYYKKIKNIHITQVNVDGFRSCYDITKFGVNKGNAVKEILKYLSISPSEAVAFGDGMNDVQMLEAVGESFAMGNGNPNLFPHAKYKAKTAEQSGIYYGLKQLDII